MKRKDLFSQDIFYSARASPRRSIKAQGDDGERGLLCSALAEKPRHRLRESLNCRRPNRSFSFRTRHRNATLAMAAEDVSLSQATHEVRMVGLRFIGHRNYIPIMLTTQGGNSMDKDFPLSNGSL